MEEKGENEKKCEKQNQIYWPIFILQKTHE
jgi:hypothetical protein